MCFGSLSRTDQRFSLHRELVYARPWPVEEIAGNITDVPTPSTCRGVRPEAPVRHSVEGPARPEAKTSSRPSGVQAGGPPILRLSNVNRRASPPVAGTT